MQLCFAGRGGIEWSLEGRCQGGSGNSPLLPESYKDIKKSAEYLKGTKSRAFYASPLQHTLTTAIMLRNDMGITVPVIIDDRLKEFNLGDLEGMKFVDAESQYPDQIKAFHYSPERHNPSTFHGEDFERMIERGKSLISNIVKRYPNKDNKVLLVSHGAALCALIRTLESYDVADTRKHGGLTNTSSTILGIEDQRKTFNEIAWSKTSYLDRKITNRDTI